MSIFIAYNIKMVEEKSEENLLKERKESLVKFIKIKYEWISYLILAVIVYISIKIRTANLLGLRDITTGGWTLGPDLDPFLFLRWAKYIIANGELMPIDMMRYVPLGFETRVELILHPYLIAWFHKIAVLFGSTSVEQSAAIFPVVVFALTVVVFFLFTRQIFIHNLGKMKSNIIALLSSLFLSVIPVILPRTIAGIPEKESLGFFFLFLSLYLFLKAWESKDLKSSVILAVLAGLSTACMALVWGGYFYIFLTIGISLFVAFTLGKTEKSKLIISLSWLITSSIFMGLFSERYTPL